MSYDETSRKHDNIKRGFKQSNPLGTAAFFFGRALDPFLQYGILGQGYGSSLIERVGGATLPLGPPLITNTPFDALGLSPYRAILLSMAVGSAVKQNIHLTAIMQEEMTPGSGLMISAFNTIANSINSLLFVCAQTSASVNGEHFPQTPLIVGASLYTVGLTMELFSEYQRHVFKTDPANKGKVYAGGLFGVARHINYLGYTMWRSGYALAAGGWIWGAAVAALSTYDFCNRSIPALQHYCEERYGAQYEQYKKQTPYRFMPFVY